MGNHFQLNSALDSPLGKASEYVTSYSPSLLFAIPRQKGREMIGISDSLPFTGVDMWTGFELSWLNPKGKPCVAIADFSIPYDSEYLIESKSFKLYLNSLNQTIFDSLDSVQKTLQNDLSHVANTTVDVCLHPLSDFKNGSFIHPKGICLDDLDIEAAVYDVCPSLLKCKPESATIQEEVYTHLFKSNCPVTGQPDWATVYIHYKGPKIEHASLLKYLISFRNHQGFHEQCAEKIFVDLVQQCQVNNLTVYARFTRRGGLDINPFRSNFESPPANARLYRQ